MQHQSKCQSLSTTTVLFRTTRVHPDDQTPTFEMTPGFKPFTVLERFVWEKNPIVSVTYENERISIKKKNSLPDLKCVLRLSCVVYRPIYGRFMGFYVNG